jgi:predicted Zn-dependent peptidase
MKLKFLALAAFCFVAFSTQAQIDRSKQPIPGPAPTISLKTPSTFTLKNGLKVMVVENHKLPKVNYSLRIDNGPIYDGDKAGISQILAAMLGNGTSTISKNDFNEEVDFLGANLNFGSASASGSSLTKYSNRILELMADAAMNPLLTEEEFQKEKEKAIENLKSNKKSVDAVASRVSRALSYGKNHPSGEFVTEETLNNITLNNVISYYHTHFNPSKAYLVVLGDVNVSKVKKQVKKYFGKWEHDLDISTPIIESTPNVPVTEIDFIDMPNAVQSNIQFTNNVNLEMKDEDYHAVLLANYILGGGGEGYLFLNLREDKGYTYGSYSSIGTKRFVPGRFSATASVRNEVTDSSVVAMLGEIKRIRTEKVDAERLKNAKAKYVGSFVLAVERPSTVAGYALNIELNNLPQDFYKTYLSKINAVTADDILRVANKYFLADNGRFVIVGKGSEVVPNLEKTGFPIKYYDAYANPVEKPVFSKAIPNGVTVSTVLDQFFKATGGKDKMEAVKSLNMNANVKIDGVPIPLTANLKTMVPNKESMEMSAGAMGVLMSQKWNGKQGYQTQQGQRKELTDAEIAEKKSSRSIFPELDYTKENAALESIVSVEGNDNYLMKVTKNDKTESRYYDVVTGLLTKTESSSEVQGKKIINTVMYSNYQEVDGLQLPFVNIIKAGPQNLVINMTTIQVNEGVKDADFD